MLDSPQLWSLSYIIPFYYLHASVSDDGALSDAAVAFLGDRVRIEGVSIHDSIITVAMLNRAPHLPFSQPATIAVIRRFRLENETLVEQDVGGDGEFLCDDTLPDVSLVIVLSPSAGEEVEFAVAQRQVELLEVFEGDPCPGVGITSPAIRPPGDQTCHSHLDRTGGSVIGGL